MSWVLLTVELKPSKDVILKTAISCSVPSTSIKLYCPATTDSELIVFLKWLQSSWGPCMRHVNSKCSPLHTRRWRDNKFSIVDEASAKVVTIISYGNNERIRSLGRVKWNRCSLNNALIVIRRPLGWNNSNIYVIPTIAQKWKPYLTQQQQQLKTRTRRLAWRFLFTDQVSNWLVFLNSFH